MSVPKENYESRWGRSSSTVSEIEEENECDDNPSRTNHLCGIREEIESNSGVSVNGENNVFVGVGKSESSMDALSWTLRQAVDPSTSMIYLIHIYSETHYIPYPLGKIPKSQATPEQVNSFMSQELGKRRELLTNFINACSASKVKVDTILVESDMVAKAILELVPILNIRKLVLGASRSSARKLKSRKGTGIADQVLQSTVIDTCEVKIISEGKEVIFDQMTGSSSPHRNPEEMQDEQQSNQLSKIKEQLGDPFSCLCFKPKVH